MRTSAENQAEINNLPGFHIIRVPEDIPHLPLALKAALPGDHIVLGEGEINSSENPIWLEIDRPVVIRGAGPGKTTVYTESADINSAGTVFIENLRWVGTATMNFPPPVMEVERGALALKNVNLRHWALGQSVTWTEKGMAYFENVTYGTGEDRRALEDSDSFPEQLQSIPEPQTLNDRVAAQTAPYYQSFAKEFYAADASLEAKEQSTLELFEALIKIQEDARQEDKYYRNELLGKLAAAQIAPLLAQAEGMSPEKFAQFTYKNQKTIKEIMENDDLFRAASLILLQDKVLMAKVEEAFRETYPMVIAEREFTNQLRRWRSIFSRPSANTAPATDRFIKNLSQAMETLPESLMNNIQDPSSEAASLVASWIQSELLILQAHELPPKTGRLHQRKEELSKNPIIG